MKKNISKIAFKTNKIVSLSKSDAKAVFGGATPTKKTNFGASICWCND